MRSRRFVLGVCCALAAAAFVGCGKKEGATPTAGSGGTSSSSGASGGSKRIILLSNGDDPFWDTCESGAKQAEKELGLNAKGFTVTFERPDGTDQGQIDKLKQYN